MTKSVSSYHTQGFIAICDLISVSRGHFSRLIQKPEAKQSLFDLLRRIERTAKRAISLLSSQQSTEEIPDSIYQEISKAINRVAAKIAKTMKCIKEEKEPYTVLSDRKEAFPKLDQLYRMHQSEDAYRNKIQWGEYALLIEQKLMRQQQESFKTLFIKIRALAKGNTLSQERKIYLSYAWPSFEFAHEFWTYSFVQTIADDLEQAGLEVSSHQVCSQHFPDCKSDRMILFGSRSFFKQHQEEHDILGGEVRTMHSKIRGHKGFEKIVIPVLISGDKANSFPPEFQFDQIKDVIGHKSSRKSYPIFLKEVLEELYSVPLIEEHPVRKEWNCAWNAFWEAVDETRIYVIKKGLLKEAVEEYLLENKQFLSSIEMEYREAAVQSSETLGITSKKASRFTHGMQSRKSNKIQISLGMKNFVGRKKELGRLSSWILGQDLSHRSKLIVIHGQAGIGKKQLAIRFARSHLNAFSVVYEIDASRKKNLHAAYQQLAISLQVYENGDTHKKSIAKVNLCLEKNEDRLWLLIVRGFKKGMRFPAAGGAVILLAQSKETVRKRQKFLELQPLDFESALPFFDGSQSKEYEELFKKLKGIPKWLDKARKVMSDGCSIEELLKALEENPAFLEKD